MKHKLVVATVVASLAAPVAAEGILYDDEVGKTAISLGVTSVGNDVPLGKRWAFSAEAGYIYTDGLKVTLTSTAGDTVDLSDLLEEAAEIRGKGSPGYPFLNFGFSYRF